MKYLALLLLLSKPLIAEHYVTAGYVNTRLIDVTTIEHPIPFTLEMIDPDLVTDLYLAFWGFGVVSPFVDEKNPRLTGNFLLTPLYLNNQDKFFSDLEALKDRSKNGCKFLISLGGWGFNDPADPEKIGAMTYNLFSMMVGNPDFRKQFIKSCIDTLKAHNLDGIDIDWEYPGDLMRGGHETDLDNYFSLLKELKYELNEQNPKWILSIALPATVPAGLPQKYRDDPDKFYQWIALVSDHVHRITLMAYDYHGAFDRPKLTGVNAPLYRDYNPKSTLYIENSVNNYLNNKVPQGKILLGLPLYGRGYQGVEGLTTVNNTPEKPFQGPTSASKFTQTPGLLAYSEIQNLIDQSLLLFAPDIVTDTARAYSVEKKVWYSFDNPQTLKLKAAFAMKKQLKGAIFWSIDMDGFDQEVRFPNIRAVKEQFDKNKKD